MAITVGETSNICMGCGACAAVCTREAIDLRYGTRGYRPFIGPSCINCGRCEKVCPGISWKSSEIDWNSSIGAVRKALIGHAIDPIIRKKGSSGGAAPAIIIQAIEEGRLGGAIVSRMCKTNPLMAEPFLAQSKEDVLSATGSKYCPVPAVLGIRDILNAPEKKFAFVGLPCHIRALKRAESIIPELTQKIAIRIGLFCHHTPFPKATIDIIGKAGEISDRVLSISYRTGSEKRSMNISMDNNQEILIDDYWGSGFGQLYEPYPCTTCPDHTNEGADISLGDPWGLVPPGAMEESLILVRTEEGERFIESAIQNQAISVNEVDIRRIEESLRRKMLPRKGYLKARLATAKFFGLPVPNFALEPPQAPTIAYAYALVFFVQHYLKQQRITRDLFSSLHPIKVSRLIKECER